MAVIRIRESMEILDGWNAAVSFDYGPEYDVTVHDPFSKTEEELLEWYFEKYPQYPRLRQGKASEVANSITTYGELLFQQVFGQNLQINFHYRNLVQSGLQALRIEIAGSPKFHALHWESLKDPELPLPLVLQATIVRQNLNPPALYAQVRSSPTINLLIVTARPRGKDDPAGYRTISRPLVEALRNANLRVKVKILRPGTYKALKNHLDSIDAGYYHVIHFDMHGKVYTYDDLLQDQKRLACYQLRHRYGRQVKDIQPYEGIEAFLLFESEEDNKADLVEAKELANLLVNHQIPIAILNACQSGKQVGDRETSLGSHLMQAGVQLVLAMGYSVNIRATELLMSTLYQQLFANDELPIAIRSARIELYNDKMRLGFLEQAIDLEDWLLPVIYQNQTQPLKLSVREFTSEEEFDYFENKAEEENYATPELRYGFVGRDSDILQIEKCLLARRNILLVLGTGGAGKTTLLLHLRSWWHTTGFVEQVFYFGYDEGSWTLQQIMDTIAQRLLDLKSYRNFQRAPLTNQQMILADRLRSEKHLLILDNLESINGAHLTTEHTLSREEQTALRSFLTRLVKGHTLVMLSSRTDEDWLARGTFENNIYELSGLDPEAASALANHILEEQGNTDYRENEDFHELLTLLGGFPLAIEIVLDNLSRQSPAQVLDALQARYINRDRGDSQEKTESLIRCIDYSYRYLAPEVQQLLLCLAPFSGIIQQENFTSYLNHLQQQPALAYLPFEQWWRVIRESQNWGLLEPDPEFSRVVHIRLALLYFLRCRLEVPEQTEKKQAIETAFRQLYEQISKVAYLLLSSQPTNEGQVEQKIVSLEYENLDTALNLALQAQVSVLSIFQALTAYLDIIGDEQRALELSRSVLDRLEEYPSGQLNGMLALERIHITGTLAYQQTILKQYQEAEVSYQRQLEFLSQMKYINEKERQRLQAITYHNLGNLAFDERNWKKAGDYYTQERNIKFGSHGPRSLVLTYGQLGNMARPQGILQEGGEEYFKQAPNVFTTKGDRSSQAMTYLNLGVIEQLQQHKQEAAILFRQALNIFQQSGDSDYLAKAYHHLGSLALEEQQWQEAKTCYQEALRLYIYLDDKSSQAEVYAQLGKVAEMQSESRQACEYLLLSLETYTTQNDTLGSNGIWVSLAQLWQQSNDASLLTLMSTHLKASVEEVEATLHLLLEYIADAASQQDGSDTID